MIKALARAFRWRKLLEAGVFAAVEEMAAAEKINASYVSRVLRLTLLAPDIVESILAGRQPSDMTLAILTKPFPAAWGEQSDALV
jgi:hypothetical protein